MTFEEAANRYSELRVHRDAGQLGPQEFIQSVAQLRLQDSAGKWWQVEPASGNWLSWNGSAWVSDQPPIYQPPPPPYVATPVAPPAPEPVSSAPPDIASLIQSNTLQRASDTQAEEAWLEGTAQKLRTALLGYGLQAKILGTRLTPNAALIRFMGSDRLRIEDLVPGDSTSS